MPVLKAYIETWGADLEEGALRLSIHYATKIRI